MEPFEQELFDTGAQIVAGLDEAGRGALFGPVVAAVVVLDRDRPIEGLNDSKQLSARRREDLYGQIDARAADWAVGIASAAEIDEINILQATRLAMRRALAGLRLEPDHLLVDALELHSVPTPQTAIVKGDARCASIAAASIMAKCARDALIAGYHRRTPGYGLGRNKGYGTEEHRTAILQKGFSAFHRRTFRVQGTLPF